MKLGNVVNKVLACLLALFMLAACSTDTVAPQLNPASLDDPFNFGLFITDTENSVGADRLFDNTPCVLADTAYPCPDAEKPGTGDEVSWQGTNEWDPEQYPISVEIDLRANWILQDFHYFVGNMPEAETASLNIYVKGAPSDDWRLAGVVSPGKSDTWNTWQTIDISEVGAGAKYAKLEFAAKPNFFNIPEVYFTHSGCFSCTLSGGKRVVP